MSKDRSENKSIDTRRAGNIASLRAVVAGYLIYLGVSLVRDRLTGKSDMALWLAWVCCAVFVIAGAAFGWYTWKRWRAETTGKPDNSEVRQSDD